jgi:hypothetical protein
MTRLLRITPPDYARHVIPKKGVRVIFKKIALTIFFAATLGLGNKL